MKYLNQLAVVLVLVGGLNWGLVGLMNLNLVTMLFGEASLLTMVVYDLVGLSALYLAFTMWPKMMKM